MDGFYTVTDFLTAYAVSRTEFYRQVHAGKIRLTKMGRSSRVAKSDAVAWAESLPTVGGEA
jgi:excisionase family DNA binding protein